MAITKRKQARLKRQEEEKERAKKYLGISGTWSTLELVVMLAAKFGATVRGDKNPVHQLRAMMRLTESKAPAKPKNRIRTKQPFYESRAWKILRYQAFEKYGNRCQCCGATPEDEISLHVDHIKPRSTHPELQLDLNNLQILCCDCNVAKLNQWDTDWRP